MTKSARTRRSRVRSMLKCQAWQIEAALPGSPNNPITVRVAGDAAVVTIVVAPPGSITAGGVVKLFAAPERVIIDAIRAEKLRNPGGSLKGAVIATRCDRAYDQGFKTTLSNLLDRAAITHDDADGYNLAEGV